MALDREFPESSKKLTDGAIGLASPWDRLAAYILDCALLLPLVQIFQSPIKKWILESFLYNDGAEVYSYRVFNLVIFISLFIIYYTAMIYWKGQTLGKMFFGLRVISYHGKINFFEAVNRSIFTFFGFLGIGIPFLSIFSHPMRRPAHDRVADTLVISDKNPVSFPTKKETGRAQWVRLGLSSVFGICLLGNLFAELNNFETDSGDSEQVACTNAKDSVGNNIEKLVEMNLRGDFSSTCLYDSARSAIWKSDESVWPHFAMALSLRADPLEAKKYMNQLCEQNSNHHLCDLGKWLQENREKTLENLFVLEQAVADKKLSNVFRILVAAQYSEMKEYKKVEELLSPINEPGPLEPVVASLYFHSLLGQLKWDEAYWIKKTHASVGNHSLLYFIQLELKNSQMSVQQQIELLDYFYPQLGEQSTGRSPASKDLIPSEIRDIYKILEGRL